MNSLKNEPICEEIKRRGLMPWYWDGRLHNLPRRMAQKHREFIIRVEKEIALPDIIEISPPQPTQDASGV